MKKLHPLFLLCFSFAFGQNDTVVTYAKVKHGIVVFKKQIPSAEAQNSIREGLKSERKGYYRVKYSKSGAFPMTKKKVDSPAAIVLKTTAGLLFIVIGIIAIFR